MDEQARKLTLLGLTDEELATFFGVTTATLSNWQDRHTSFAAAIASGKEIADAEVAASLFKRATGMNVKAQKAFKGKNGEVVVAQTITEIPPDPRAAVHWLANRRRGRWGSYEEQEAARKAELEEETGTTPEELTNMQGNDLDERIRVLEERRRQEEG